jgi:hypothetical protein
VYSDIRFIEGCNGGKGEESGCETQTNRCQTPDSNSSCEDRATYKLRLDAPLCRGESTPAGPSPVASSPPGGGRRTLMAPEFVELTGYGPCSVWLARLCRAGIVGPG